MEFCGTACANCWEEVEVFEAVTDVFETFAVAGEEYCARAGTVADADDVALAVWWAVRGGVIGEGLVVAAGAVGEVGEGVFVVACGDVMLVFDELWE